MFNKYCVGIDMSKAFDNIIRSKLIRTLRTRGVEDKELDLIQLLRSSTTLQIKRGKQKESRFETNKGVLQRDGLSPRLFTCYLDEALREIDQYLTSDHNYAAEGTCTNLHGHDYDYQKTPPHISQNTWKMQMMWTFSVNPKSRLKVSAK